MEQLLLVQNLVKQYPGNEGVENIGFTIGRGKLSACSARMELGKRQLCVVLQVSTSPSKEPLQLMDLRRAPSKLKGCFPLFLIVPSCILCLQ